MKMKKPPLHTTQINLTNMTVSESPTQRNTLYNYIYMNIKKEARLHSSDYLDEKTAKNQ